MRILHLNLIAFGPFTGSHLDLSEGQQGLHLVYGPNEAGKSSMLRAISDLLFGIHPRTNDNFVHPYPKLRIGARIEHSDGSILDCVRRKGNQNTLRDADDIHPIGEDQLARCLGNIDRDVFHTMFGIDHERLRRGGAEIVEGGGRLGASLFAADAGLSHLHEFQQQLQSEIDELFKPPGRAGSIIREAKDYQAAVQAMKDSQVSVETWRHHDERLQAAEAEKKRLDVSIRTLRAEQNRLIRIRNALPAVARWKQAREKLQGLGKTAILPGDFADSCQAAIIELRKAEHQKRDADADLTKLRQQRAAKVVPTHILNESDAIEALRDRLGGYRKAMADRPGLETRRDVAENKAKEILRGLNRAPDLAKIEQLRLPADKAVRIQDLGNQKEAVVERLQAARRDCDRIHRAIQRSEDKLQAIAVPRAADDLRHTTHQVQLESDLESRLQTGLTALKKLQQEADVRIQQIRLWNGSVGVAETLAVPTLATIDRFDQELNQAGSTLESLRTRLDEENIAIEKLDERLKKMELEQAVPTLDELAQRRATRDEGWQLVVQAWREQTEHSPQITDFIRHFAPLQNLADAYAQSVKDADHIADRLRTDADRVATNAAWQAERQQRCQRTLALQSELHDAESRRNKLLGQWQAQWAPIGIEPATPAEMREWREQFQKIAELAERIRTTTSEVGHLQERFTHIRSELCSKMSAVGATCSESDSLRSLLMQASQQCEQFQLAVQQRDQLTETLHSLQVDLEEAKAGYARAEHELTQWLDDWEQEMRRLGLEGDAIPAQANRVLADINELFKEFQQADQFQTRLDGIEREARDFQTDVREVAQRLIPSATDLPTADAINLLVTHLQEARSTQQEYDSLDRQISGLETKTRQAGEAILDAETQLTEMCRQAECASHDQLSDAARRSDEYLSLAATVRDLEDQLIKQGGGATLDEIVVESESEIDHIDSIAPRLEELERELEQLHAERDEVVRSIEREKAELRQVDGSSEAAEKAVACETVAASMTEQVEQLAVLRMSAAMLQAAMERYREKNQDPVLSRASEVFSQLTQHRFQRLQAGFNERGEPILTGVRSDSGAEVNVAGMSDGTCDQLYLALRLASLESRLDQEEPLPFIVDDVLVNFDDDRASAALEALEGLSEKTQVIFFTHHRHLVDLAQRTLSSDQLIVHELQDTAVF